MPSQSEALRLQQPALDLQGTGLASALSQGAREILRSIFPPKNEAWLAQARLELYWNGTRSNMLIVPVASFLVALAVSPWTAVRLRIVWWCGVALVSLGTHYASEMVERHAPVTLAGLRLRSAALFALITLFFCTWCSMGAVLWVPGVLLNHLMLLLVLACSMAGCMTVTAMHPALMTSALAAHAAFLIAPAATSHYNLDRTLGALAAVFTVMMATQGIALCRRATGMLRLEQEHKALADELRAAKEEADRQKEHAASVGQARSEFFSHMNHELRTPMNAILGFSEMIHRKQLGDNVDAYAEYAGIIHDSGKSLLALIDNVLNLSKIQGGQTSLRESDVSLCRLLESGIEQYETQAADAELELTLDAPAGLPFVRADERALRKIFANLLSNAIKFTLPGGRITAFAQMESDDRIAFGVEDTGIGIAPEHQADAFDRFGHGRHDVTSADRGAGLGLAIVKGFAEAHDAEVQLESALGKGTRVTVYLPARRVLVPSASKLKLRAYPA